MLLNRIMISVSKTHNVAVTDIPHLRKFIFVKRELKNNFTLVKWSVLYFVSISSIVVLTFVVQYHPENKT
jgi:hypothetical protein